MEILSNGGMRLPQPWSDQRWSNRLANGVPPAARVPYLPRFLAFIRRRVPSAGRGSQRGMRRPFMGSLDSDFSRFLSSSPRLGTIRVTPAEGMG